MNKEQICWCKLHHIDGRRVCRFVFKQYHEICQLSENMHAQWLCKLRWGCLILDVVWYFDIDAEWESPLNCLVFILHRCWRMEDVDRWDHVFKLLYFWFNHQISYLALTNSHLRYFPLMFDSFWKKKRKYVIIFLLLKLVFKSATYKRPGPAWFSRFRYKKEHVWVHGILSGSILLLY